MLQILNILPTIILKIFILGGLIVIFIKIARDLFKVIFKILLFPLGTVLAVIMFPWNVYHNSCILFQSIKHKHHMLTKLYIKRLLIVLSPYALIFGWVSLYKVIYHTKPYPHFINDLLDKKSDERTRILCLYQDSPSRSIQNILETRNSVSSCYKEYRNLTLEIENEIN